MGIGYCLKCKIQTGVNCCPNCINRIEAQAQQEERQKVIDNYEVWKEFRWRVYIHAESDISGEKWKWLFKEIETKILKLTEKELKKQEEG